MDASWGLLHWWLRAVLGGAVVLLTVRLLLAWVPARQAELRERLGAWGVRAALLVLLCAAFPPWIILAEGGNSLPGPSASGTPRTPASLPTSRPALAETMPGAIAPPRNISPREPSELLWRETLPPTAPLDVVPREAISRDTGSRETLPPNAVPRDGLPQDMTSPQPQRERLPLPVSETTPREADSVAIASAPPRRFASAAESASAWWGDWWRDTAWQALPWLMALHLTVAVGLLSRLLGGFVVVRRVLRSAEPAPWEIQQRFASVTAADSRCLTSVTKDDSRCRGPATVAGKGVRVCLSAQVQSPICCGLWRPTILLPLSYRDLDPRSEVWNFVLLHEWTHLRHGDNWTTVYLGIVQALFWWLPGVRKIRQIVRECQEYLADAATAHQSGKTTEYAAFLVQLAQTPRVSPMLLWNASAVGTQTSSELFRRVHMLLRSPIQHELGTRTRFGWFAIGLLSLAVVLGGIGLRSVSATPALVEDESPKATKPAPADTNKEKPTKPDPAAKPDALEKPDANVKPKVRRIPWREFFDENEQPGFPKIPGGLQWWFQPVPMVGVPEEMQKLMQMLQQGADPKDILAEMQKLMQKQGGGLGGGIQIMPFGQIIIPGDGFGGGFGGFNPFGPNPAASAEKPSRLGVRVEKPSEVITDQLQLPKDQGLVIREVVKDSPAEKAGLKPNDILLELAAKPVPSDAAEFAKAVEKLEAGKPMEAVILRQGRKEKITGIELAAVKPAANKAEANPATPGGRLRGLLGRPLVGGFGKSISVSVTNNSFQASSQEGDLTIQVIGKLRNGTATPSSIVIVDGDKKLQFDSLANVPADYKPAVEALLGSISDR